MQEELSLEDILRELYSVTGLQGTIYGLDEKILAQYPDKGARFCEIISECSLGVRGCVRANHYGFELVKQEHKVHLYQCHMGLYEAVVPLYHYGTLAGYMMMGQMLEESPSSAKEVFQKAANLKMAQEDEIKEAINELVKINLRKLESFVTMCRVCADYITNHHKFPVSYKQVAKELSSYLDAHFDQEITLEGLCRQFGYSKTRLNQLFVQYTGMSIYHYLMKTRIENACRCLRNSKDSIYTIAARTGFSNQNYFSRQFKKYVGCTPMEYRKQGENSESVSF